MLKLLAHIRHCKKPSSQCLQGHCVLPRATSFAPGLKDRCSASVPALHRQAWVTWGSIDSQIAHMLAYRPQNVLVDSTGWHLKLADFGLARLLDAGHSVCIGCTNLLQAERQAREFGRTSLIFKLSFCRGWKCIALSLPLDWQGSVAGVHPRGLQTEIACNKRDKRNLTVWIWAAVKLPDISCHTLSRLQVFFLNPGR